MNEQVLNIIGLKLLDVLNRLKYPSGRTYTELEEALLLFCNEIPPHLDIISIVAEQYGCPYHTTLGDKLYDIGFSLYETYGIDIEDNITPTFT